MSHLENRHLRRLTPGKPSVAAPAKWSSGCVSRSGPWMSVRRLWNRLVNVVLAFSGWLVGGMGCQRAGEQRHRPCFGEYWEFNRPVMRLGGLIFAIVFAGCLVVTPPGVCQCWLMVDPSIHHPHFSGHPELPHQHDYLLDYFQLKTVVTLPSLSIPAALLIASQAASGLPTNTIELVERRLAWSILPPTPPPRFVHSLL